MTLCDRGLGLLQDYVLYIVTKTGTRDAALRLFPWRLVMETDRALSAESAHVMLPRIR